MVLLLYQVDKLTHLISCLPPRSVRSPGDQAIHFIYPSTSQLLHYETSTSSSKASSAKVPMELFLADPKDGGVSEIDMRNDLVEAGIDICSVDVSLPLVLSHGLPVPPSNIISSYHVFSSNSS